MRPVILAWTALALPVLPAVYGFFRINCGVVQTGRIDPLVSPNLVAAHVHTIVGGSS